MTEAEVALEGFLDKFDPRVADDARHAVAVMRRKLPGAIILVFDNYNALAVGFGPNEKTRQIALSIAVYPRWVSLFLAGGPYLDDPHGLLKGEGNTVRHVVLSDRDLIEDPRIITLIDQAVARCETPIADDPPGYTVIKSISAKQRPRRPNLDKMG